MCISVKEYRVYERVGLEADRPVLFWFPHLLACVILRFLLYKMGGGIIVLHSF